MKRKCTKPKGPLRLAHRIATQSISTTYGIVHAREVGTNAMLAAECGQVAASPCIIADRIATTCFGDTDTSLASLGASVSPWPRCTVEYRNPVLPQQLRGLHVNTQPREKVSEQSVAAMAKGDVRVMTLAAQASHIARGSAWITDEQSGLPMYTGVWPLFFWGPDGVCLDVGFNGPTVKVSPLSEADVEYFSTMCWVVLTAFAFCHCKNVPVVDVTEEVGPTSKWRRQQRAPEIKYHTIDVGAASGARRDPEGDGDGEDLAALHMVRGNFATYTADNPLFGRLTGKFWRPQHVRGKEKNGITVSDYQV